MLLDLNDSQFETLRNMVDFATAHAADGLSPALSEDYIEDAVDTAEYFARYAVQKARVVAVRKILGLDEFGDYIHHQSHYITEEKFGNS